MISPELPHAKPVWLLAAAALLVGGLIVAHPARIAAASDLRGAASIVQDKAAPESVRVELLHILHRGW